MIISDFVKLTLKNSEIKKYCAAYGYQIKNPKELSKTHKFM
jgi:hypothetical protein